MERYRFGSLSAVMARSGYKGKALVQLFLERGGEVRGKVIPKLTKRHVQPGVNENIEAGSKLYTDSGSMYKGLGVPLRPRMGQPYV